jgi:small neutral amino acid transporter SnatA (MarC family)
MSVKPEIIIRNLVVVSFFCLGLLFIIGKIFSNETLTFIGQIGFLSLFSIMGLLLLIFAVFMVSRNLFVKIKEWFNQK